MFRRGWRGWYCTVTALALLLLPAVSGATPIVFRLFNLGETRAYVVQRNATTISTGATSTDGVLAERLDAAPGDLIEISPNLDLAPPAPPLFTSATAQGAACAHLAWTPSGDPSVVGYRISYGVLSVELGQMATYQYSAEVGPISSYDACSLANTTYYFAIQAINYSGQLSAFSQERSVAVTPTAVLISRFDARADRNNVQLSWNIESDETIDGFVIYRRSPGSAERPVVDTPLAPSSRSFVDSAVRSGTTYTYVLAALGEGGAEYRSAPVTATTPSLALALEPNSPNPFRADTRIGFTLNTTTHATVRVYDVTGALVATLFDGMLSEGDHTVSWNGRDTTGRPVASGAYFYTLTANKQMQSRKMLLVR
ncbi:MAG TPA: FlgD immunoglobulin-like domain containing protein [Candidatus Krumholzibacteria bacterium]|nr:FlgD immunoglobulin-like domain containing protein [Candidatus Krumholzibacteria bacterium]